jgi:hypothetical protein
MATGTLTGSTIASTYKSILKVKGGANTILDGDIQLIEDGDGVDSVLGLATDSALINGDGSRLYFYDADGDEHISADTSGVLSIAAGAEIDLTATAVDLNGTLDVSGNTQLSGTVTVSADGTGKDVIFYSGTAGDNFTWDASEECLIITGTDAAQSLKVADGDLVVVDKIYLYDNDGGEYIHGSSDGHLEVNSGTTLDITAPTVDVNASTAITLDGDVLVGNGKSVVIGHTAQETVSVDDGDTDLVPEVQVLGTHMADSSILLGCWANSGAIAGAPSLCFAKSRNATIGSHSRVSDNDQIGNIIWFGDDGVDLESPVCQIQGEIDDDPDTGDMPGRILFFTTTGGGEVLTERLRISSSGTASFSGNVNITGAVSKGSGSFKIDHPLPSMKDTHHLVHSFTESPRADLIYRDKVTLVDGSAIINIDTVAGMTEGTFVLLCDNVQCFTSNESDWSAVKGSVSGNILTIECEDSSSTADVAWMVVGDRQDEHIMDTNWTDENGKPIIEPEKPIIEPEEEALENA